MRHLPSTEEPSYKIVEIFHSLQGEGYNTGMPSIFIRFGTCNLTCDWCDTEYNKFTRLSLSQIYQTVKQYDCKNIIITGGEPTIQPQIRTLLQTLKQAGYFLAIETNGLTAVPPEIDYIACSPKAMYAEKYRDKLIEYADEVRIVCDDDILPFCQAIAQRLTAKHYYLSPCERGGVMNILETITAIGQLNSNPESPHWQLSIQSHKLANIE